MKSRYSSFCSLIVASGIAVGSSVVVGCGGSTGAPGGSGGGSASGGSTGSGGGSGSGSGGSASGGATGSGGSGTGSGGKTGSGGGTGSGGATGSGGSGSGSGGNGSGGATTGSGGATTGSGGATTGSGGATTGSGGAAGSGSGSGGSGGGGGSSTSAAYRCPGGATYPGPAIPSGAMATRVMGAIPSDDFNMNDFGNVEGPVWIGDSLYYTDMNVKMANLPPSRILKLTPGMSDMVSVFVANAGANGMAVDNAGNLVTANHGKQGIVKFTVPGAMQTTVVSMFGGKPFDSPNDLTIATDGTIYFTDPSFQTTMPQQPGTHVYQILPGASEATVITDYTNQPNGITLSLDEKTLYVGGGSGVKAYTINNHVVSMTGTQFGATDIGTGSTDGMVMDCAQNLYVAGTNGGTNIVVVDSTGKAVAGSPIKLATTGTPPQAATNLAFGGADHKTLYITGQGSAQARGLYEVKLGVPGMPY